MRGPFLREEVRLTLPDNKGFPCARMCAERKIIRINNMKNEKDFKLIFILLFLIQELLLYIQY